ncbi:MAG TPA: hypothetical protein VFI89_02960 [Burkholderiales bacterium]|nr:hypothetical protein [Burkholderiales bacterium]
MLQGTQSGPPVPARPDCCDYSSVARYLVVEVPDPEEPDPVAPLEAPLLGDVLGEVVLLPEPVAPELEPDLLKCASHSEREIWPSLLVSTDENVGAAMLELVLPDDIPDEPEDIPDEPLEPDAEGVVLLPEDELCAIATLDRARSAAAVALVTSFNIDQSS